MSGTSFLDEFSRSLSNVGRNNQVAGQPMQQPRFTPAIEQLFAQPVVMPESYGVSRFLTGPAAIPLTYNVPVPGYQPFQMQPGSFRDFMSVQDFSDPKNPVIPVYDPITRTYIASQTGTDNNRSASDGIIGYNANGSPVYATAPSQGAYMSGQNDGGA